MTIIFCLLTVTSNMIKECSFVKVMWERKEKIILGILPVPPYVHEKALGMQPTTRKNGIRLS